jgi:hypothetical protein
MKITDLNENLSVLFEESSKVRGIGFAGYGISAPKLNYDDYDGLDIKRKVVLCFVTRPNMITLIQNLMSILLSDLKLLARDKGNRNYFVNGHFPKDDDDN